MNWWLCARKRIPSPTLSTSVKGDPTISNSAFPRVMRNHMPRLPPLLTPPTHLRAALVRPHTLMLWTLAPREDGGRSWRKNVWPGCVKVTASTAEEWATWLGIARTRTEILSVPQPLRPCCSRTRTSRMQTRTRLQLPPIIRTGTCIRILSMAMKVMEVKVWAEVKASWEMLRPTAA